MRPSARPPQNRLRLRGRACPAQASGATHCAGTGRGLQLYLSPRPERLACNAGAEVILPFSPLADEAPAADADLVWLPGGYPELHAGTLAAASTYLAGLREHADTKPVHGECGGYMALGETSDRQGRQPPPDGRACWASSRPTKSASSTLAIVRPTLKAPMPGFADRRTPARSRIPLFHHLGRTGCATRRALAMLTATRCPRPARSRATPPAHSST